MSKRQRLTEFVLKRNPPKSGRLEIRDSESPLVFRVTENGNRSFCVRTYLGEDRATAKPVRVTYDGAPDTENLSEARQWARRVVDQCKAGIDPRTEPDARAAALKRAKEQGERRRFGNVVANYLERRVRKAKNLRTADEVERMFNVYFLPRWRDLPVTDIELEDINAVLDDITDRKVEFDNKTFGGPVAADRAMAQLRACLNWYETQDGKYRAPRLTTRVPASKLARDRVLSDAEVRALWQATAVPGTFNGVVRMLLLTAQRREEVASIARAEIDAEQVWTIPAERYKTGRPNIVPLTPKALKIVEAQDRIKGSDLVFTTNGKTPFSGFGKSKERLDAAMLAKLQEVAIECDEDASKVTLPAWRLHDLRRTAKTLMARAGVRPDISERVLGHVISGVEGVYDRYQYVAEKRDALERLAAQIERIIDPPTGNVVMLREAAE